MSEASGTARIKRLVLDVLKPHQPNLLEFTRLLAEQGHHRVTATVAEMDEKTETLRVVVEGDSVDLERIRAAIVDSGASLHSIDEVEAENGPAPPAR